MIGRIGSRGERSKRIVGHARGSHNAIGSHGGRAWEPRGPCLTLTNGPRTTVPLPWRGSPFLAGSGDDPHRSRTQVLTRLLVGGMIARRTHKYSLDYGCPEIDTQAARGFPWGKTSQTTCIGAGGEGGIPSRGGVLTTGGDVSGDAPYSTIGCRIAGRVGQNNGGASSAYRPKGLLAPSSARRASKKSQAGQESRGSAASTRGWHRADSSL